MRKWMFVCAVVTVVGFFADSASAQEPVPAAGKAIGEPTVVQPGLRNGLFRGRRTRGETVTVTPAVTTAKPMPSTTAPSATPPATQSSDGVTIRQGLLARLRLRR